jgi:hypothetical protein
MGVEDVGLPLLSAPGTITSRSPPRDADPPCALLELLFFLLRPGQFESALKLPGPGGVTSPPYPLPGNPFVALLFPNCGGGAELVIAT